MLKLTQEQKVKQWLEENDWLSTEFFEQFMTTSAFHRAIWNLENKMGVSIEHGEKDMKGFRRYRLKRAVEIPKVETPKFQPQMFRTNTYY